jgi:hypothetical protein
MFAQIAIRTFVLKRFLLIAALLLMTALQIPAPSFAQTDDRLRLDVAAGYDGFFRENAWFPVLVQIENDGDAAQGRIIVRPETSGSGVLSAYSVPVDLPRGARQTVRLYMTAQAFTQQIRVELLTDGAVVLASAPGEVRSIQPQDRLAVVITDSLSGSVDLSGVKVGGFSGLQANIALADLPDKVGLMDAVNLLVISDVDSGSITREQRAALSDWITAGGHLIVTGGANWQATATGLAELLPIRPTDSVTVDNLDALGAWLGREALVGETIVSAGALNEGATALLTDSAGDALIARRAQGNGTIDYLTFDPNAAPVREWDLLPELWYTLASSTGAEPSWTNGFTRWNSAAEAVEILPGLDLLPDILPLCGFIVFYILLIGPVNYLVLSRFNRRELAWITIPLLIIAFTAIAYILGSNLRGNEATLSRLTVVQSFPNSENARVQQVVGLLSPRRAAYDLAAPNAVLHPLPVERQVGNTLLATNVLQGAEIRQAQDFRAAEFTIDASDLAEFISNASVPRPALSGLVSLSSDGVAGQMRVRGSVSNESAFTLNDAVILARGATYRLSEPLEPGDVVAFELTLSGETSPHPILYTPTSFGTFTTVGFNNPIGNEQTVTDLIGIDAFDPNVQFPILRDDTADGQELRRRQLFLDAFARDVFNTTGRGDQVYLAGWTDSSPLENQINNANWRAQDSTLYIVQLENQRETNASRVTISRDQFTWVSRNFTGFGDVAPSELRLDQSEEVIFRFTPHATARMNSVEDLYILFDRTNTAARSVPIELWDWAAQDWASIQLTNPRYDVPEPERFIGPMNAVQIRLRADDLGGFMRISQLAIEQRGRFE